MRLLIDTQILIWFLEGNKRLPEKCHALIRDAANEVMISRISLLEIAIKLKVGGRLTLDRGVEGVILDCQKESIRVLPMSDEHILAYQDIPFYDDHRDPFDRMMLATALAEEVAIISSDGKFQRYHDIVTVIW